MTEATIRIRLQDEMKKAMLAKDQKRLDAIRLILAAVKRIEVDERIIPDDQRMLGILSKMVKQQQDSITQYKSGHRQDLVDKEQYEINVIQEFLPAALSETDVERLIVETIAVVNAKTIQDIGKIMGVLKPKIQGRADMTFVNQKIKQLLDTTPQ